jgi:pimeloyl-ACP methyl ester carboxylesterase
MGVIRTDSAPLRQPRRPWRRLARVLFGALAAALALCAAGAIYQASATALDQRAYRPPGQLFDVGGYKLHIFCMGESHDASPTVILDAQNGGTVSHWAWIQPELAKSTRVCAYDREGLGWSEPSPRPQDSRQNAAALHTLLRAAGVPAPYVLVGHSFGGLYVRMYADRYPDEIAGMVLIEGTHPDVFKRLGMPDVMPGADERMVELGPLVSRLGLLRITRFITAGPDLPARQQAELNAYYASTKFAEMIRRQYHLFATLLAQVRAARGLGDTPLAVVLGSQGDGGIDALGDLFAQQAALSSNSVTRVIDGATHLGLVTAREHALQTSGVIADVVEAARRRLPPSAAHWTTSSSACGGPKARPGSQSRQSPPCETLAAL